VPPDEPPLLEEAAPEELAPLDEDAPPPLDELPPPEELPPPDELEAPPLLEEPAPEELLEEPAPDEPPVSCPASDKPPEDPWVPEELALDDLPPPDELPDEPLTGLLPSDELSLIEPSRFEVSGPPSSVPGVELLSDPPQAKAIAMAEPTKKGPRHTLIDAPRFSKGFSCLRRLSCRDRARFSNLGSAPHENAYASRVTRLFDRGQILRSRANCARR
jgi:hypothetical protein